MARCLLSYNKLRTSARGSERNARVSVTVRASAEPKRRQVLQGIATTLGILPVAAANAVSPINIIDDRASKKAMDVFDQATDLQEDIRVRRGETQYRNSTNDSKARLAESRDRILNIADDMKARRWTASRNELRNQTGYMRYDLDNVINSASDKEKARSARDNLVGRMERLDYALAQQNIGDATAAHKQVVNAMDDMMAALG